MTVDRFALGTVAGLLLISWAASQICGVENWLDRDGFVTTHHVTDQPAVPVTAPVLWKVVPR